MGQTGKRDPDVRKTQAALKALREGRPLSQKQLAKLSGVPSGTLAQIETGRSLMSSEVAVKTARSLNTDPVSLLVASNAGAIKARIERGDEGPGRARRLLVEIRDILDGENLSPEQERALLDSAGILATLLESDQVRGAGDTPEDRLERLERASAARPGRRSRSSAEPDINDALDRDYAGRRMPQEMAARKRAERSGDEPESPEAATKRRQSRQARGGTVQGSTKAEASETLSLNKTLDRDAFGRRKGTH